MRKYPIDTKAYLGRCLLQALLYLILKITCRSCWNLTMNLNYGSVIIEMIHCITLFQNRELQIMRKLEHLNIVKLKFFFYSAGEKVGFVRACLYSKTLVKSG